MPSDVHTHTVLLDFTRCYVAHWMTKDYSHVLCWPDGYQHVSICCYSWDTCSSGHVWPSSYCYYETSTWSLLSTSLSTSQSKTTSVVTDQLLALVRFCHVRKGLDSLSSNARNVLPLKGVTSRCWRNVDCLHISVMMMECQHNGSCFTSTLASFPPLCWLASILLLSLLSTSLLPLSLPSSSSSPPPPPPPPPRPIVPMEYMGEEYFKTKATVVKYERFVLKVRRLPSRGPLLVHCKSASVYSFSPCSNYRNSASVCMWNTLTRLVISQTLRWTATWLLLPLSLYLSLQMIVTYLQILDIDIETETATRLRQRAW